MWSLNLFHLMYSWNCYFSPTCVQVISAVKTCEKYQSFKWIHVLSVFFFSSLSAVWKPINDLALWKRVGLCLEKEIWIMYVSSTKSYINNCLNEYTYANTTDKDNLWSFFVNKQRTPKCIVWIFENWQMCSIYFLLHSICKADFWSGSVPKVQFFLTLTQAALTLWAKL